MTDEKFLAEVGHVLLSMDCDCDEVPAGDVHCPAHRLARIIKIIEKKDEEYKKLHTEHGHAIDTLLKSQETLKKQCIIYGRELAQIREE
jgi:hypothetical protein